MMAVPSGDEDGHAGSPSRLCHTHGRKTGLEARTHGVSGAEPATGPDLSERVEQVRAALSDADRVRFDQDLTRRWTRRGRPGASGTSATWSRAGGGWCSLVSTAVGGGGRPRRGYAAAMSRSGSEPLDVEDAISRYLA
jgi:hypothetical protein